MNNNYNIYVKYYSTYNQNYHMITVPASETDTEHCGYIRVLGKLTHVLSVPQQTFSNTYSV